MEEAKDPPENKEDLRIMEYLDEKLLEAKRELEYQKHTTLQTGMYAGEELFTFSWWDLPQSQIRIPLPDQFVEMPEPVRDVKYPSREAPKYIWTSLDSTVNICFNVIPMVLKDGELGDMIGYFRDALQNINPSIAVRNQTETMTRQGNEMGWFEYKGHHLDGQTYDRVYLIRMRKCVLHGTFICLERDRHQWGRIAEQIFLAVEENL